MGLFPLIEAHCSGLFFLLDAIYINVYMYKTV